MQKTFAILVLAFAATMAFAQTNKPEDYKVNQSGAQKITNGPVIESTSDHSAMIAWSTKDPGGTYIAYGTDQNNLSQRTEKAWEAPTIAWRSRISSLRPPTTSRYGLKTQAAVEQQEPMYKVASSHSRLSQKVRHLKRRIEMSELTLRPRQSFNHKKPDINAEAFLCRYQF